MNEKIVIDFKKKETESGWARIIDAFGLKSTPVWFDWLSWILIMGVFQYLFDNSTNKFFRVGLFMINMISAALIITYFNGFFSRIEFHGIPFIRSRRKTQILSLILSCLLAFAFWKFALALAGIVKAKP